jgi:hypothetical protein
MALWVLATLVISLITDSVKRYRGSAIPDLLPPFYTYITGALSLVNIREFQSSSPAAQLTPPVD